MMEDLQKEFSAEMVIRRVQSALRVAQNAVNERLGTARCRKIAGGWLFFLAYG
jgi:hypothetical protein